MNRIHALLLMVLLGFSASPSSAVAEDVWDPAEKVNRGIFWFNDKVDYYFLEPVADGYDYVVPETAQEGVNNFFRNLRYPAYLLSDVVQLKFGQAVDHTGRFLINSTIGILGLIDVAKHVGLPDHEEDFGTALAYHGVPPGPYVVLPFLGPSNVRDAVGLVVDRIVDPFQIFSDHADASDDAKRWIPIGALGLKAVQTRVNLDEAIKTGKEASLDYYLFVQSAYYQYRQGVVYDGRPPVDPSLSEDPEAQGALSEN